MPDAMRQEIKLHKEIYFLSDKNYKSLPANYIAKAQVNRRNYGEIRQYVFRTLLNDSS
jgi:hypothetical protein